MKSREELRNDYEEALFAIIMDDIMSLDGEKLIAERERLAESDEYEVPEDVDARCLEVIRNTFDGKERDKRNCKVRKVWRTLLIAALISCLGFMTVYATVPAVRSAAKNLVIQFYNSRTCIQQGEENAQLFSEYDFRYIPDGFVIEEERNTDETDYYKYVSSDAVIIIRIHYDSAERELSVDSENADNVERIIIKDFEGLIVEKDDRIHIAVVDTQIDNQIQILASGVDKQTVIKIVENIHINN